MKFIILLSALMAVALCVPLEPVPIVRSSSNSDVDGTFSYGYETGDGTIHDVSGNVDGIQGKYSYTSPEGEKVELSYIANVDGVQVQGSHLPVEPPTPEHVLRTLEWNKAHPEEDSL